MKPAVEEVYKEKIEEEKTEKKKSKKNKRKAVGAWEVKDLDEDKKCSEAATSESVPKPNSNSTESSPPLNSKNQKTAKKRKLEEAPQKVDKKPTIEAQKSKISPQAKKFKFNKKQQHKNNFSKQALSEERLKAFGINPKKFNNKLKYGKKNQAKVRT